MKIADWIWHAKIFNILLVPKLLRDDHIKGTSHRKANCDLLQVVCRHS
jgi:hypothetical protein